MTDGGVAQMLTHLFNYLIELRQPRYQQPVWNTTPSRKAEAMPGMEGDHGHDGGCLRSAPVRRWCNLVLRWPVELLVSGQPLKSSWHRPSCWPERAKQHSEWQKNAH